MINDYSPEIDSYSTKTYDDFSKYFNEGSKKMERQNIYRIFFTNEPWKLNEEEKKIHILINIAVGTPFLFLFSYIVGNMVKLFFLPFFFVFCFYLLGWILYVYYWDKLNDKYSLKPAKSSRPYSYQGYVILLTLTSPAFFLSGLALGYTSGNIWFGLGGAVAVVYPIFVMFLRIKTFSDDSIIISKGIVKLPENLVLPDGKEPFSGKKEIYETILGFGYMPISYWILSAGLGLFTVGAGFSKIQLHFTKGTPSLEVAFIMVIVGLMVQSIYLFPDILNKIVPIDLRTKNGFVFMFILAFILFGITQWFFGILLA